MSNAEPALPWGAPQQEEAPEEPKETMKPIDLKAGQRVRVRLDLLLCIVSLRSGVHSACRPYFYVQVLWEIHEDDDAVTHKVHVLALQGRAA